MRLETTTKYRIVASVVSNPRVRSSPLMHPLISSICSDPQREDITWPLVLQYGSKGHEWCSKLFEIAELYVSASPLFDHNRKAVMRYFHEFTFVSDKMSVCEEGMVVDRGMVPLKAQEPEKRFCLIDEAFENFRKHAAAIQWTCSSLHVGGETADPSRANGGTERAKVVEALAQFHADSKVGNA
jgi:hypothetical protein